MAGAVGELAQLREQAQAARSDLARLHKDVVEAEERVVKTHAAQLLKANEQLVVSTLRVQADAEKVSEELREVTRSTELDALTELPKRALLLDRFAHAIANARRHGTRLALLFLDLDNFKQVNDTLGHAVGDEALKVAAHCLVSSVRDTDTVSRHGGDEFLILLAEVSQWPDAVRVADKVIAALGGPHTVGDQVVRLKASIGISIYPDDGEDPQALIDRADAAMYLAKRLGLGSVVHGQEPTAGHRLEGQ